MQYTIVVGGKPEGPYLLDELTGKPIVAGTFIRTPGMDDYKEAHEFPELCALFGFHFQRSAPQYFAAFDQRLLAAVIDYFLVLLVYIALLLVYFVIEIGQQERIAAAVMGLPLVPLLKLIYSAISDATVHQGTAGKRLLRIKVTDMQGSRISTGKSFMRQLAKVLSVLPVFFGYLYAFLNKKGQCWHDIAMGTLVIKDRLL